METESGMKELLYADSRALHGPFATILATQTPDNAFKWIVDVLAAQAGSLRSSNSHLVAYTGSELALEWFESTVASPVSNHWGTGAALLGASWPRVLSWLKSGGPQMLMALDTLIAYRRPAPNMAPLVQIAAPVLPEAPSLAEFEGALSSTLEASSTPRIKSAVESVLRLSGEILRGGNRGVAVSKLPKLYLNPDEFMYAQPILEQHESVVSGFRNALKGLTTRKLEK